MLACATYALADDDDDGAAVVLLHADIADRRMWRGITPALAVTHRIISYDRPDFGDSEGAGRPVDHRVDLLALLDRLDVSRAWLVGSSMGGAWALEAALEHPDRVAGLVLVCSGLFGHEFGSVAFEEARRTARAAVPPERLAAYRDGTASDVHPDDVSAMAAVQARRAARRPPDRTPTGAGAP